MKKSFCNLQTWMLTASVVVCMCTAANAQNTKRLTAATGSLSSMPMSDTGFISKNIMDNMMEIQLSQLGIAKSTDARIKSLSQQMVSDHTQILNDLKKAAKSRNMPVAMSDNMNMGSGNWNPGSSSAMSGNNTGMMNGNAASGNSMSSTSGNNINSAGSATSSGNGNWNSGSTGGTTGSGTTGSTIGTAGSATPGSMANASGTASGKMGTGKHARGNRNGTSGNVPMSDSTMSASGNGTGNMGSMTTGTGNTSDIGSNTTGSGTVGSATNISGSANSAITGTGSTTSTSAGNMSGMSGMAGQDMAGMQALQSATGAQFDAQYVSQMLAMHEAKLAELQTAATTLTDPELKLLVTKAIPKIRMHRDMLLRMNKGATNAAP